MFFPRLRRHAKWMFVFLAVALGGGFVLFGVGAGGTGVGDIFRGGGNSSGAPSVSKAEKKTEETPKNVEAWRDLSTALQTDGQTERAISAQEQVVVLAPKDADALRELAGLYLAQANAKQQEAQILQVQAAYASAGDDFPGAFASPAGQSLVNDSISVAIRAQSATKLQTLISAAQVASTAGVDAYRKVAVLAPGDPNVQLELAQTAQQAGDTATAIAAYQAFLKLAPDDANAPIVKQQLKQLASSASG
jgi:tetratricopeptide (TPR) repeat protein